MPLPARLRPTARHRIRLDRPLLQRMHQRRRRMRVRRFQRPHPPMLPARGPTRDASRRSPTRAPTAPVTRPPFSTSIPPYIEDYDISNPQPNQALHQHTTPPLPLYNPDTDPQPADITFNTAPYGPPPPLHPAIQHQPHDLCNPARNFLDDAEPPDIHQLAAQGITHPPTTLAPTFPDDPDHPPDDNTQPTSTSGNPLTPCPAPDLPLFDMRSPPWPWAPDAHIRRCMLDNCTTPPFSAPKKSGLVKHLQEFHRPNSRLPREWVLATGLHPCFHHPCPAIYCSPASLANHERKEHGGLPEANQLPAAPIVPPNPTAASLSSTDYFTPNYDFFNSIPLKQTKDSTYSLHHVHSNAMPSLTRAATTPVDATLHSFLYHALTNLDDDAPNTAIHSIPRILLFPADSSELRTNLTPIMSHRAAAVKSGHAPALWKAYPWLEALSLVTTFPKISPEQISVRISNNATLKSPSSVFKKIGDPNYMPPTAHAKKLLLTLFPQATNPDAAASNDEPTPLSQAADQELPAAPLGSGFIHHPPALANVVNQWRRHISKHPTGGPDGTGLRSHLLLSCTHSLPLLAQWLHALVHARTTPAHRAFLSTKILRGKVKPHPITKELPTTPEDTVAARPLACHSAIRRLIAGFIAKLVTVHLRPLYLHLTQWGLVPSGLEAAPRRHQLYVDLATPTLVHAAMDIKNAHTSIARQAILLILTHRAHLPAAHSLDRLLLIYFLSYYQNPTVTIIQVARTFEFYLQTDALDQGEALASHLFGLAYATVLRSHLYPAIPQPFCITLIHDDTTLIAPPFHPTTTRPHPPATLDELNPNTTPLPYAIQLLETILRDVFRCELASGKTHLLQRPLPPAHKCNIQTLMHLFPTGTSITTTHIILAGIPIMTHDSQSHALTPFLTKFEKFISLLLSIPALDMQLALLVLTLSLRPSSRFGHLLRALPPGILRDPITSDPALPNDEPTSTQPTHSFCDVVRHHLATAFCGILRITAHQLYSAPSHTGTLFQFYLSATQGGVALPDSLNISPPANLGSFICTLPILMHDPHLAPILQDCHRWPTLKSNTLSQAHHTFHFITQLKTFTTSQAYFSPLHPSVISLLTDPSGKLSIYLMHNLANRHPQSAFSTPFFLHALDARLNGPILTDIAKARIRHAAHRGVSYLFTAYYIPTACTLTNAATQFKYCHHLGIELPASILPTPPLRHCLDKCNFYPPSKPYPPNHFFTIHITHGYHPLTCRVTGSRNNKHNALVKQAARTADHLHPGSSSWRNERLSTSTVTGTIGDLVIEDISLSPPITTLDFTISCPLLPSYVNAAAISSDSLFTVRTAEKNTKHLNGCIALGRHFLPVVFSSLGGIGPPDSIEYIDRLFAEAYAIERRLGGSGSDTHHQRTIFYQTLQAILATKSTIMIQNLTRYEPPETHGGTPLPPPISPLTHTTTPHNHAAISTQPQQP